MFMCPIVKPLAVPVIAIFTKFDALDNKAYRALRQEGCSWKVAKTGAPQRAILDFERDHLGILTKLRYPPKDYVYLRGVLFLAHVTYNSAGFSSLCPDMNRPDADCSELTRRTAAALDDIILQQIFVSTQRNNLELCIQYAMER
jgi:hypothetical protein